MCHHSIPGIIAPVINKRDIDSIRFVSFIAVFVLEFFFFSAIFLFEPIAIQDIYTLNLNNNSFRFFA
jgi:hypothetical protein